MCFCFEGGRWGDILVSYPPLGICRVSVLVGGTNCFCYCLFLILPAEEGQDEYEKDGFIVDDVDEEEEQDEEEREDSDEERQRKKKRKKK